jgi:hypothetical protein
VEKEYEFDTEHGKKTLADLKLTLVSRAPLEKLQGFKQRMGWSLDWASTVGSEFNRDLGFLHTEEELKPFLEGEVPPAVEQNAEGCGVDAATYVSEGPGLSAYILSEGTVYRTYVTTARGLEPAMAYYGLLDRTPKGRNEEGEQVFWGAPTRRVRGRPRGLVPDEAARCPLARVPVHGYLGGDSGRKWQCRSMRTQPRASSRLIATSAAGRCSSTCASLTLLSD